MIPAHIIKKIKRIHIKSRRTVDSLMAGQYRSVFRGAGIEFEEVREYVPGDEVKNIDWKVSARMGRPFVKLYREERESIVMLLVDMSASLHGGSHFGSQLERAAEVASVLAFNAVKNNDKVGVLFFTDQVESYIPPKKGSSHVWRVIREIFTFTPRGRTTDIGSALDYLAKIQKKRAIVFVLSDFLDTGYLKSLQILRQKHEVIGVMIHDPGTDRLPAKGVITLTDFETGETRVFDAFDRKTRNGYSRARAVHRQEAAALFSRARSDMIEMATRDSISKTLRRYFRLREQRLR